MKSLVKFLWCLAAFLFVTYLGIQCMLASGIHYGTPDCGWGLVMTFACAAFAAVVVTLIQGMPE